MMPHYVKERHTMAEKRRYVVRPFPPHTLEQALAVPQTIQDKKNGLPMNRILLASALGRKPASSQYKLLLSSSLKYGLTTGTEKSETIGLTSLGVSAVKPRDPGERNKALRTAALQPELLRRIYEDYNNGKLPQGDFFLNILERDFHVPHDRCGECAELLVKNGLLVGIVQELQGTLYVLLEAEGTAPAVEGDLAASPGETLEDATRVPAAPVAPQTPPAGERYIFIAHGKNRKPLEQLEKVLKKFGVPYKVAVDEPQLAQPISMKVAQTMRECSSAILIFTADEEFTTPDAQTIWRPSQNVIYELGAASVLYDNRIVIFKEEGLDFPTDFHDIGNIPFEKDRLDAKGVDLIQELIALKLIKLQPA